MSEQGTFMRVAGAIGDLGNPFYREERQRDVWNEASAVGLQAMLWSSMIAANVMVWVGGRDAIPYALGIMAVVGLSSLLVIGYAARLGVDIDDATRMWRPATFMFVLLLAAFAVGMLVAVDWAAGGFGGGVAVGTAAGTVIASGLLWRRFGRRGGSDA